MVQLLSFLSLLATTALAQETLPPTPAKGTPMSAIPIIGLGTARVTGNATEVIAVAIENGFRHIDCAMAYGNQKAIGLGIKEGLRRTGLTRQDLWITSKHFNDR
jgi:alcohol dehydrogenase (NADP+)